MSFCVFRKDRQGADRTMRKSRGFLIVTLVLAFGCGNDAHIVGVAASSGGLGSSAGTSASAGGVAATGTGGFLGLGGTRATGGGTGGPSSDSGGVAASGGSGSGGVTSAAGASNIASGGSGASSGLCGSGCSLESTSSLFCNVTSEVALICFGPFPSSLGDIMQRNGCTNAPTDAVRYCCPPLILSQCS
jgi:hypothetical protein